MASRRLDASQKAYELHSAYGKFRAQVRRQSARCPVCYKSHYVRTPWPWSCWHKVPEPSTHGMLGPGTQADIDDAKPKLRKKGTPPATWAAANDDQKRFV